MTATHFSTEKSPLVVSFALKVLKCWLSFFVGGSCVCVCGCAYVWHSVRAKCWCFATPSVGPSFRFTSLPLCLRLVRVTNKFLSSICVDCLEKGHGKIPWPSVLSHQAKDQMEPSQKPNPNWSPRRSSSHFTPLDNCRPLKCAWFPHYFPLMAFLFVRPCFSFRVDLVLLPG